MMLTGNGTEAVLWMMLICLTTAAVTALVLQLWRIRRYENQLSKIQSQLDVFSDASINVARCVDRLALGQQSEQRETPSSRRWLLEEAQLRLAQGKPMQEITAPLGLSRDEVRLLLRTRSKAADFVEHSHKAVAASH